MTAIGRARCDRHTGGGAGRHRNSESAVSELASAAVDLRRLSWPQTVSQP